MGMKYSLYPTHSLVFVLLLLLLTFAKDTASISSALFFFFSCTKEITTTISFPVEIDNGKLLFQQAASYI